MSSSNFQQRALAAYAAVQDTIPADWRLPKELLAPAWVYPEDFTPSKDFLLDVRGIPASCGILSQRELEITETDAPEILQRLASKEWSSVDVTTAFCKRAAIAQQLTRCCTELMFEAALRQAKELDDELERTGKVVGPFHGLPLSIKDQFDVEGVRTSIGLCAWVDVVAEKDSDTVTMLKELGAVIYVKTNVPQSLMSADSVNAVWGRVLNPTNRSRTAGGSTGGEAALLAMKGSPLGLGTDIAGSIRIPMVMCGGYSLKPSSRRVPVVGVRACGAGAEFVPPLGGPMGHSVAALELFMRALPEGNPHLIDPQVIPRPWTPAILPKKLRIGILRQNNIVRPHPPIARVLSEVEAKLVAAGHEVVEWDVGDMHKRSCQLAWMFFGMDGGRSLKSVLAPSGEPTLPNVDTGNDETLAQLPQVLGGHWQGFGLRIEHLKRWNALNLDAVIAPGGSHVASAHNKFNDPTYTLAWNLLDYPGVVIPAGVVDPSLDQPTSEWLDYQPQDWYPNSEGSKRTRADSHNHAAYKNVEEWAGLPISLQVFTLPHQEEKALAVAGVVDQLIKGN